MFVKDNSRPAEFGKYRHYTKLTFLELFKNFEKIDIMMVPSLRIPEMISQLVSTL